MQILFKGGQLFDGEREVPGGQAVLVEKGRIAKVAPAGEFAGFAGKVMDTSGGTLLPGLIDCHVHLCMGGEADPGAVQSRLSPPEIALRALENAQLTLRRGVVAVRDCGGKDYIEFPVRDAIRRGTFVGTTIRAAGRMICMTGGHGNRVGRVADGVDEVIKAVREQIHAGADFVKIMATGGVLTPGVNPEDAHYTRAEMAAGLAEAQRFHKRTASHAQGAEGILNAVLTPGVNPEDAHYTRAEMAAGLAEAKRFHKRTASHAQGAEGILNAVLGGVSSIEHGILMNEECLRAMIERGTYLVPTLAAVRNIVFNKDKGIPSWAVDKATRMYERHLVNFRAFYEAGGLIAMGTDAGTPFNLHGENSMELEFMVEAGMKPLDALRASTANGADLADLPEHGRLKPGAAADLLLVAGDPMRDITRISRHANHLGVFRGGEPAAGLVTIGGGLPKLGVAAASF